jgi:hypothetical protein
VIDHADVNKSSVRFFFVVEEYFVLIGLHDNQSVPKEFKWSGAATGAYIGEPSKNKAFKEAKVVVVQAESAAEAITGARQTYPGSSGTPAYAALLSNLNKTL